MPSVAAASGRDEALLRRHVHRDLPAPVILLAAAAPHRVRRDLQAQVGAAVADVHLASGRASSAAPRAGAVSARCSRPALVAGRVLRPEPAEREDVLRELPLRLLRLELRDRRGAPTRRSATRRSSRAAAPSRRMRARCRAAAAGFESRHALRRQGGASTSSSNSPITCTIATSSLPSACHCAICHGVWWPRASFDARAGSSRRRRGCPRTGRRPRARRRGTPPRRSRRRARGAPRLTSSISVSPRRKAMQPRTIISA